MNEEHIIRELILRETLEKVRELIALKREREEIQSRIVQLDKQLGALISWELDSTHLPQTPAEEFHWRWSGVVGRPGYYRKLCELEQYYGKKLQRLEQYKPEDDQ